jgi:hypothetical protein
MLPLFTPNYMLIEDTDHLVRCCRSAGQRMLTAVHGATLVLPGYPIIARALSVSRWGHHLTIDSRNSFTIREKVLRVCYPAICSEVYT